MTDVSKENLIRLIFHELKGPIGAVAGYLALLQAGTLGQNLANYQDILERSQLRLEQMQELLHDLHDIALLESENRQRQVSQVVLEPLLQSAIVSAMKIKGPRVSVAASIPDGLSLRGNTWELTTLISHLLSNAVKYNKEGGSVRLIAEALQDRVQLTVADTGIGIRREDIEKLFKDFVRLKNPLTRHIPGTGLGLPIVGRIAHLYEGAVEVESEVGKGSTFRVTLANQQGD